jgi:hypothetical protein
MRSGQRIDAAVDLYDAALADDKTNAGMLFEVKP